MDRHERNYRSGQELFNYDDLDEKELNKILNESGLDRASIPLTNTSSNYNQLLENQRFNINSGNYKNPVIPKNTKRGTSRYTLVKLIVGWLLTVLATVGATWLWGSFIKPMLKMVNKEKERGTNQNSSKLVITDVSPELEAPDVTLNTTSSKHAEPTTNKLDNLFNDLSTLKQEFLSMRTIMLEKSNNAQQTPNNVSTDVQICRSELNTLRSTLDRVQTQLDRLQYDKNNNDFRKDNSNQDKTLADLRVELAGIKGMLKASPPSQAPPQFTYLPMYYPQPTTQPVSQPFTQPTQPTQQTQITAQPTSASHPVIVPQSNEHVEPKEKQQVEAPSYENESLFKQHDSNIDEIGEEMKVDPQTALEQYAADYNKALLENTPTQPSIATTIVDQDQPKTSDHNDNYDDYDDVIFGGEAPSFDSLYQTAQQSSSFNPYAENLLNKTTSIEDEALSNQMKQTVESEPKFKKSKLFDFINDVTSVDTEPVPVISEPVTPTQENQIVLATDQTLLITPSHADFANYDFDHDDAFIKSKQFVLSKLEDGIDQTTLERAVLKLKGKHFKKHVDSTFDFESYCKQNNIEPINKDLIVVDQPPVTVSDEKVSDVVIEPITSPQIDQTTDVPTTIENEEQVSSQDTTIQPNTISDQPTSNEVQPEDQKPEQPKYPKAYGDILQKMITGEGVQGIKVINDKPTNPNRKPTPSTATRKAKPWEKKNKLRQEEEKSVQDVQETNSPQIQEPTESDIASDQTNSIDADSKEESNLSIIE
ncbi:peroxisomal membrane protein [Acrasis kona]|uniref:Peroxisomal membrane protein n=1 Tax=Acrasis kona TaxID=1008807 RepID=A0AAW2Z1F6_9EUKA